MNISSEYPFPIFISSTDYNLKDLRAELADFLKTSGYTPILSSATGFPDDSPNLEPWESCLPVLENSYVMSLIIDGRYGTSLKWPNFGNIFDGREVSPTHGEYIFAHTNRMRMLVFIRKELMAYYQSYRKVKDELKKKELKKVGGDKEKIDYNVLDKNVKKIVKKSLPNYVEFETLKFINEVKTKKPIPWIMEFDDITDIKAMIQKKMINELSKIYLIKSEHFNTVVDALNKILSGMTENKREEALAKINGVDRYKDQNQELQNKLKDTLEKLEKKEKHSKEEKKQIEQLKKELDNSKNSDLNFSWKNDKVILNTKKINSDNLWSGSNQLVFSVNKTNCESCNSNSDRIYDLTQFGGVKDCPSCNRTLCNTCWNGGMLRVASVGMTNFLTGSNHNVCSDCRN